MLPPPRNRKQGRLDPRRRRHWLLKPPNHTVEPALATRSSVKQGNSRQRGSTFRPSSCQVLKWRRKRRGLRIVRHRLPPLVAWKRVRRPTRCLAPAAIRRHRQCHRLPLCQLFALKGPYRRLRWSTVHVEKTLRPPTAFPVLWLRRTTLSQRPAPRRQRHFPKVPLKTRGNKMGLLHLQRQQQQHPVSPAAPAMTIRRRAPRCSRLPPSAGCARIPASRTGRR